MKNLLLLGALLAGWPLGQAHAQIKLNHQVSKGPISETLTNKGVIALTMAGLPPDIITSKIASSTCAFDVSTTSLLALKQAHVDDAVIKAMLERAAASGGTASKPLPPRGNKLPKLDIANHPYLHNSTTGTWTPLEKATSSLKSKMVAMGYGGVKMLFQIPNEKSPSRLTATDSTIFLLNTFGTAIPELVLYQAKPERGNRAAVGAKVGGLNGVSSGQDVLTFNILPMGNGIFRLVPTKKLPPGEYFFAGKPVGNVMTVDAYAFGID